MKRINWPTVKLQKEKNMRKERKKERKKEKKKKKKTNTTSFAQKVKALKLLRI